MVIGTGASAAQFVPEIAEPAAHLTILQRTPAWFLPTPGLPRRRRARGGVAAANVPGYTNWLRFWNFWQNVEGLMVAARVDPDWDNGGASVSQVNELIRQLFAQHLQAELVARPDLLPSVMPDYPPFSKRFIRDDGAWARTIQRDDVDLVTSPIAEIVPEGVRTEDGTLHEADVLVFGTGFTASDFLMPMRIVGRDGVELHDRWKGDAPAYLGITLPGYPNLFLLYGPNTNIVVNGSITYFSECEVHHVVGCIEALLREGARALEPTQAAHDSFNEEVDAENLHMAWGVSSVNTWYKNPRRPHRPELALQPAGLLGAHPQTRPRGLHPPPIATSVQAQVRLPDVFLHRRRARSLWAPWHPVALGTPRTRVRAPRSCRCPALVHPTPSWPTRPPPPGGPRSTATTWRTGRRARVRCS